jgi:SAM-dependent methyltransferase
MDNKEFWNNRYKIAPELGSGPGSRGYCAWYKQELLKNFIKCNEISSILDVGCGDMEVLPKVKMEIAEIKYIGLDISEYIVNKNSREYPKGEFFVHDIVQKKFDNQCELVVCFDVLLHQCDEQQFRSALRNLLNSTTQHALISYPADSGAHGEHVESIVPSHIEVLEKSFKMLDQAFGETVKRAKSVFWGDLENIIREENAGVKIRILGDYRNQKIYEITKTEEFLLIDC